MHCSERGIDLYFYFEYVRLAVELIETLSILLIEF
jgi:hypothetical protein